MVEDDVQVAADSGRLAQLELQIDVTGPVSEDELSFQINDQPLTGGEFVRHDDQQGWTIRYALGGSPPLKQGKNVIEALLKDEAAVSASSVKLTLVRLLVRYRDNPSTDGSE